MNTKWLLETHGDPLGAIQNLFIEAWDKFELEAMVVPSTGNGAPHLIYEPEKIRQVNPFKPLMTTNTAKFVPQVLSEHPEQKVGVLLRPCEVRALEAKARREKFNKERLLTMCTDCLGTHSPEDYQWRTERKGSADILDGETLKFAKQGGIASYRFRSACQSCRTPVGGGADINIGVIGLPVRQKILVDVRNGNTAKTLGTGGVSLQADESLDQRDDVIARMLHRGSHTRHRMAVILESVLPGDVEALIDQFERCGECRTCFKVCPLCAADFPSKDNAGRYEREQVKQWMISCAGCGMCEQACPNHLPLVTIFTQLRQQLLDSTEEILVN